MKKRFLAALATGMLVVGMGGMAQAYSLEDETDVGEHDVLIEYTAKYLLPGNGTSEGAELEWVRLVLGSDEWYFVSKDDNLGVWNDVVDDEESTNSGGESLIAHTLNDAPVYFLLKTGEGNGMESDFSFVDEDGNVIVDKQGNTVYATHFLFENKEDLDWAVVSLAEMGFTGDLDYEVISHISEFNGDPGNEVPEPATMLLFGTGLAGLAGIARRRKKN